VRKNESSHITNNIFYYQVDKERITLFFFRNKKKINEKWTETINLYFTSFFFQK